MNLFKTKFNAATIVLIPACIGINYLGKMFASLLKLPLWLDSIGTCIGGCLGGPVIGAICGIGGGVIIKPVLDALGAFPVSTINFLSGCTVLSMTAYSVLRSRVSGASQIDFKTATPLAVGAAVGGLVGKDLFSMVEGLFDTPDTAGAVQAAVLMVITIGTLVYTINKEKVATKQVTNAFACAVIGLFLGIMSSFLGIGGGPINLVVLYYFFSMQTKEAAQNSLYIILFSQVASTLRSVLTMDLASVSIALIAGMVVCGILGGVAGRAVNKCIDSERVDKLFIGLMVVIILINVYNIAKYTVLA